MDLPFITRIIYYGPFSDDIGLIKLYIGPTKYKDKIP